MSRTFAAAFFATVAIIVPAAWHALDATIDKDGKHVRPLQKEIEIDGARVTVDVDRNLIHTGDPVIAKLRAFSDTPKKVAVDLTVMRSDDTFGSRVAAPPKAIDLEHLTLDATPDGGKIVETRLVMEPTGAGNKVDWFRIIVAPKGEKPDTFGGNEEADAAAIGVLGWTDNDFDISIHTKGKLVAGQPFEVRVRVENTSGRTLKHAPYINLGNAVGLYGLESTDDFKIDDDSDSSDRYDQKFRPGDVYVQKYTITPQNDETRDLTLVASAYLWSDEPGPISEGAMDARTIKLAPAPAEDAKQPAVAQQ